MSEMDGGVAGGGWYQTYAHALDNAVFIPSVTVKSMTNDVFTEDDCRYSV